MSRVEFPTDEEWLELRGTGGRYLLSTRGRIYDLVKRRLRSATVVAPMNRLRASVAVPGKRSPMHITVAKEVLLAFGAAEGKPRRHASDVAAYYDGDVANCRIENLYWVRLGSPEQRAAAERITEFESTPDGAVPLALVEPVEPVEPDRAAGGAAPGGIVSPSAVAAARAGQRTSADLTAEERREIRAWAGGPARGRIPADVIAAFDHDRKRAAAGAV